MAGNYTWNFTEYNVSPINLTDYLFKFTGVVNSSIQVYLKQNQTKDWYEWWCEVNQTNFNISDSPINILNLSLIGEEVLVNCTLSALNVSQTLVNWSVTNDRASIDFTYTFT